MSDKEIQHFDFNQFCLEQLFAKIPELRSLQGEFGEMLAWHNNEDPRAYLIYEDVFVPFILEMLKKLLPSEKEQQLLDRKFPLAILNKASSLSQQEQALLDRSFQLIEQLVTHEDWNVRCLAEVACIESLLAKIEPMRKIELFLLPRSLEAAREIAFHCFGRNPKTWEKV